MIDPIVGVNPLIYKVALAIFILLIFLYGVWVGYVETKRHMETRK